MSLRSFLYNTLKADPDVASFVATRIYQSSSMQAANVEKPFLVFHMGNDTNEMLADEHTASRQFFQVYVHDEPGDYQQIEDIVRAVKSALVGKGSPEDGVITTRYLETSQDLDDETLRTIFNYIRFQFIRSN